MLQHFAGSYMWFHVLLKFVYAFLLTTVFISLQIFANKLDTWINVIWSEMRVQCNSENIINDHACVICDRIYEKGSYTHTSNLINLEDHNIVQMTYVWSWNFLQLLSYVGVSCWPNFKSIAFTYLKLKIVDICIPYIGISYFAWEDQSNSACCIFHTVLISYITILYESYRTIM